jgi:uncharacterized alpha-E superfamily protein
VGTTLIALLQNDGAIRLQDAPQSVIVLCASALEEAELPGGVTTLIRRLQETGRTLRHRFARDFWLIASRPMPPIDDTHPQAMLEVIKELLERLGALSGLIAENMMRGPAHAFIDMGRRVERACRSAASRARWPVRARRGLMCCSTCATARSPIVRAI